jgi:hypothetical protein
VLEHPAHSHAWSEFDLPIPDAHGWRYRRGLWSCEVWQSAYGHKARKRTWLLYMGPEPPPAAWSRPSGSHQCGWFDRKKPTVSKREASATPIPFAEWLLELASRARKTEAA